MAVPQSFRAVRQDLSDLLSERLRETDQERVTQGVCIPQTEGGWSLKVNNVICREVTLPLGLFNCQTIELHGKRASCDQIR